MDDQAKTVGYMGGVKTLSWTADHRSGSRVEAHLPNRSWARGGSRGLREDDAADARAHQGVVSHAAAALRSRPGAL